MLNTATLDSQRLRDGIGYHEVATAPNGHFVYSTAAVPFGWNDPHGCGPECSLLTVFDTRLGEAVADDLARPLFRPLFGR